MDTITPPRSGSEQYDAQHPVLSPPNADPALLTPISMSRTASSAENNPPDSPCAGRGKTVAGTAIKPTPTTDDVESRMVAGIEAALVKESERSSDDIDPETAAQAIKESSPVEYTFWLMLYLPKAIDAEIANGIPCLPGGKGYPSVSRISCQY